MRTGIKLNALITITLSLGVRCPNLTLFASTGFTIVSSFSRVCVCVCVCVCADLPPLFSFPYNLIILQAFLFALSKNIAPSNFPFSLTTRSIATPPNVCSQTESKRVWLATAPPTVVWRCFWLVDWGFGESLIERGFWNRCLVLTFGYRF